ncbi:MAG: hypothetical protein QM817_00370 [Archangium sp.]
MSARLASLAALLSASAWAGGIVVFSAPTPEIRNALKSALTSANFTAVDASDIDHALFGATVKLTASSIPKEVRDEYAQGSSACRGSADCLSALSEVVWQRYIERVGAERVIEVKPPVKAGGALVAECATYQPKDDWVGIGEVQAKTAAELGAKAAKLNDSPKLMRGVRPNGNVLPGATPLRMPDLKDGVEQKLEALKVDASCKAKAIRVQPTTAPLSRTIAVLFRASLGSNLQDGIEECTLRFDQQPGRFPVAIVLACPASIATFPLYPSQDFTSPAFQAEIARQLTSMALGQHCSP